MKVPSEPRYLQGLLAIASPHILDDLKKQYPEENDLFRVPERLGGQRTKKRSSEKTARRAAVYDLTSRAGLVAVEQFDELLKSLLARRRLAERLRLAGGVIAAVSGLVAAAAVEWGGATTTIIASTFSAIGGLTTLLAGTAEKAPSGLPVATAEEYGRALEMRSEALAMIHRLDRDHLFPLTEEDLIAIMERFDAIAGYVFKMKHSG